MVARDASGKWLPGQTGNPGGKGYLLAEVRELARTRTTAALETLAEIMGNRKAPPASRVAAAVAILDRGWGKPEQTISAEIDHGLVVKIIKFADGIGHVEDVGNIIEGHLIETPKH